MSSAIVPGYCPASDEGTPGREGARWSRRRARAQYVLSVLRWGTTALFSRVISRASGGIQYVGTTNCRARSGCRRHGHPAVGRNLLERSRHPRGRGTAENRDQRTQGRCVTADPRSRHADRRDHRGADAHSAEGVGSTTEPGVLRAGTLSIFGVASQGTTPRHLTASVSRSSAAQRFAQAPLKNRGPCAGALPAFAATGGGTRRSGLPWTARGRSMQDDLPSGCRRARGTPSGCRPAAPLPGC